MSAKTNKEIILLARELRRAETGAEKKLWAHLRNRQLDGWKFLRQHPIIYQVSFDIKYFIITDFYCAGQKLILEVDGQIHTYQKDYDMQRDRVVQEMGLRVLRISNEEVDDIGAVLSKIRDTLTHPRPFSTL